MKKYIAILALLAVMVGAGFLVHYARTSYSYNGLPVVSCVDSTKPLKQDYTFNLKITVNNSNYPLAPNIGHDYGHCLRALHTDDSSGTVHVQSNSNDSYTLSQFFDVWHKEYNDKTFIGNTLNSPHYANVLVNGQQVNTAEDTLVKPGYFIEIRYY